MDVTGNSPLKDQLRALFEQLGGDTKISEILHAFYKVMASDIMIGFFFDGKDLDHIVEQQKFFLLRAVGINNVYRGKSPKAAHEELAPILQGHFNRRLVLLRETLESFNLSESDVKTWVNFEEQFREMVVAK